MIGETLEIAIVVSTIVLIVYPSAIALRRVAQERYERRVKAARRLARRPGRGLS